MTRAAKTRSPASRPARLEALDVDQASGLDSIPSPEGMVRVDERQAPLSLTTVLTTNADDS